MTQETAKKALTEEIDSLKCYEKLLSDKANGKVAHMEFVQHFGNTDGSNYLKVRFDTKHNKVFVPVMKAIISNLEEELNKL